VSTVLLNEYMDMDMELVSWCLTALSAQIGTNIVSLLTYLLTYHAIEIGNISDRPGEEHKYHAIKQ